MAKTPLELADQIGQLNRENRRNTLNKRINYKGNNELNITGGSRALDNQNIWDRNNVTNTMAIADPKGIGADWTLPAIKNDIEGLNNRYERQGDDKIMFAPKTRKERRLSDIYWANRTPRSKNPSDLAEALGEFDELPF